jgi:hypothetical protein
MWPFFMQQEAGGSPAPVFGAWKATDGQRDWNGFHNAVDGPQPFATSYRDFAVRNLNLDLGAAAGPMYNALDPHFPTSVAPTLAHDIDVTQPTSGTDLGLIASDDDGLASLATQYDHLEIGPQAGVRRLTLDFSALAPAAPIDVTVLTRAGDGTWTRRDVAAGGGLDLCFDDPGDDVQSLFVIVGNHQRVADWATPDADTVHGTYRIMATAAC